MPDSTPIAWRAIVYGTPVLGADGNRIGSVREVLGDDEDDVFHGLRIAVDGSAKDDVVVMADDVASIASDTITTDMTREDALALPRYSEEATYHLASVGWLRKHLAWKQDSKSDEEPG
jgi:uncharacterized protein YrrD